MILCIAELKKEDYVSAATPAPTPSVTPVGSVPDGKVADFLTGRFVNDTPEEYVRQNIEKALVRQYKYAPADCAPEFSIKVGSARKRVDIVVFGKGTGVEPQWNGQSRLGVSRGLSWRICMITGFTRL